MKLTQSNGNSVTAKKDLKHRWTKLTDDQLDVIAEKRHRFARKIQKASGVAKHDSDKQLSDWQTMQEYTNS
jgi:uncharacterized protein YjbJ (UPF0337 family)